MKLKVYLQGREEPISLLNVTKYEISFNELSGAVDTFSWTQVGPSYLKYIKVDSIVAVVQEVR